jgi:hypothetical protein
MIKNLAVLMILAATFLAAALKLRLLRKLVLRLVNSSNVLQ